MVLSPSLSELLQQAHIRFGLEVCVLGRELDPLFSAGEFGSIVTSSATVRRELQQAQASGRLHEFSHDGTICRAWPLRGGRGSAGGVLVIRGLPGGDSAWSDGAVWFLLRSVIEADLAAVESLTEDRQHARRALAIIRFLRFLADAESEDAVAQALVQAAAVWFDVDARVYRKSLRDEFILHTRLPASDVPADQGALSPGLLARVPEVARLPCQEGQGDGVYRTALVVPLRASAGVQWVLVLIGQVPPDADPAFEVVGRVAGACLERLQVQRVDDARQLFADVLRGPGPPEQLALRVVRSLMDLVGAAGATLTLVEGGAFRHIVRIGEAVDGVVRGAPEWILAPDRLLAPLKLPDGRAAYLDLRPADATAFSPDGGEMVRVCAELLQVWLSGVAPTLTDLADHPGTRPGGFERRIHEELERARRFDLRLALILVDVEGTGAAAEVLGRVEQALRRELRGSDVLGTLAPHRLGALLTHTSPEGLTAVVQRLRRALAGTTESGIATVLLGQAAFSPDCHTADALLSEALRQTRPLPVN